MIEADCTAVLIIDLLENCEFSSSFWFSNENNLSSAPACLWLLAIPLAFGENAKVKVNTAQRVSIRYFISTAKVKKMMMCDDVR
jgi:hypothetical protein